MDRADIFVEVPPVEYEKLISEETYEDSSQVKQRVAVQAKLEDWLGVGAYLVWIVYPDTRSVAVYQSLDQVSILTQGDNLEGGPLLPGFSCLVSELF